MRGVMLHPVRVPPASGSLPPSDVPSGNTLGSITRAVTSALRPVQLPRQPHVKLGVTRILRPPHPARPAGRRNPPHRFRSASPPPGPPPCRPGRPAALPKMLRAPACGIVLAVRCHLQIGSCRKYRVTLGCWRWFLSARVRGDAGESSKGLPWRSRGLEIAGSHPSSPRAYG